MVASTLFRVLPSSDGDVFSFLPDQRGTEVFLVEVARFAFTGFDPPFLQDFALGGFCRVRPDGFTGDGVRYYQVVRILFIGLEIISWGEGPACRQVAG